MHRRHHAPPPLLPSAYRTHDSMSESESSIYIKEIDRHLVMENVVALFDLQVLQSGKMNHIKLDLQHMMLQDRTLPWNYDKKRFPVLELPMEDRELGIKKCVLRPFSNGKVNFAGNRSPEDAIYMAHLFAGLIARRYGLPCLVSNFKMINSVCNMHLGFTVNLKALKNVLSKEKGILTYKDENQFPALQYKLGYGTASIHESGHINLIAFLDRSKLIEFCIDIYTKCKNLKLS